MTKEILGFYIHGIAPADSVNKIAHHLELERKARAEKLDALMTLYDEYCQAIQDANEGLEAEADFGDTDNRETRVSIKYNEQKIELLGQGLASIRRAILNV